MLTVNGKAELVIQDAACYQKLIEAQNRMEAIDRIRRGLESMKRNAGKPAEKFSGSFLLSLASRIVNEALRCCLRLSAQADVRGSYDWGCRIFSAR